MKRTGKMILMLILLAVMLGGYFGVQQLNQTETVSETEGVFDLTAKTMDDLTGLSWMQDETAWSFIYQDGAWQTTDTPSWPVDQQTLQDLAEQLVNLQGTRKLEEITSPADYGLETPQFSVTATWKDGTSTTYAMGDATPFADGYYLSLSGRDGTIFTVATSLLSLFSITQKDVVALEELPNVTDAERLTVGHTLDAVKAEESKTVDPEQLWYDAESGTPLDGDQIDTLISIVSTMAWKDFVTAAAGDEALSAWGLDDADAVQVTMTGSGGESVTVLFGSVNEDGDYYARLPDSAIVCTMDSSEISGLLSVVKEELWISTILPMPYDSLDYAVFTTSKGTYQLSRAVGMDSTEASGSSETDQSDSGEEVIITDTTEVDEAPENLWSQVTALKATRLSDSDQGGEMVLSIRALSTKGMETTVIFSENTADTYLAVVDGGTPMVVSAEQIDAIVRAVRAMQ